MNMGWLVAWWHQISRRPPGDPWNDDPEITRERERQHREGIADAATTRRILDGLSLRHEREFWQRYRER
jgi:hypothetical protein